MSLLITATIALGAEGDDPDGEITAEGIEAFARAMSSEGEVGVRPWIHR